MTGGVGRAKQILILKPTITRRKVMMNQKEAVFTAVINVCGVQESAYTPSKEERAQISAILVEGFKQNKISLERSFDEAGLKSYVSGLLSNWLRKDTRLNGGTKYVAKNPGSRAGQGDPTLKAMRALLSTLETEEDKAEVQAEIDKHLATIAKSKAPTIDYSALPSHLQEKFSK